MSEPAQPSRVWRFGADIDTDQLAPGKYMKYTIDVVAPHCLEGVRPEFAGGVQRGDVLVAGPDFGIGSSREQAAQVLVHLGVVAVIAPSYSGLFFRNAFNLGLLLLTCAESESLQEGDLVSVDAAQARVVRANGSELRCDPIPGFLLEMAQAGGLLNQLRQRIAAAQSTTAIHLTPTTP